LETRGGGVLPASNIENVLNDHAALRDLKTLVKAGCNYDRIVTLLEFAFWTDESWQQLVGMGLSRFQREINQIRNCADVVDRLNRSDLVYHASIEVKVPQFIDVFKSPSLSEQLRAYADALDFLRKMSGPKTKLRQHVWKACFVAMVVDNTKAPHDREVSSLIGVVLNDPKYSEKAHQSWRLTHAELIRTIKTRTPRPR
jgi:hypothetical protein